MRLNIAEINFLLNQKNKAELTGLIQENNYNYSDDLLKLLVYLDEERLFEKYSLPKSLNSSEFISIFEKAKDIKSDFLGRSIWHYLAWSGNAKALRELAEKYKVKLDSLKDNHCATPLHYLARSGNSKALRELAEKYKVKLDSFKDGKGTTLLHYLAWSGSAKVFGELAEEYKNKAEEVNSLLTSLKDAHGATPLHYLARSGNDKVLCEWAKKYNIRLDTLKSGITLLHYLALSGNARALCELIKEYEKVSLDTLKDGSGATLFHYLALSGNVKALYGLIKEYQVKLDGLTNNSRITLLHYLASSNCFLALCNISYDFKISPNRLISTYGDTPWGFIPLKSIYRKTAEILQETPSLTDKILELKPYLPANLNFLDVYAFLHPVSHLFFAKQNQAIKKSSKRGALNSMLVLGTEVGKKQFLKKLNEGGQGPGPDMPNAIWQLITFYALEQEHSIYTDDSSKNREIQSCYTKIFCRFTNQLPGCVVAGLFFSHGKLNSCTGTTDSNDSALCSNQDDATNANIIMPFL